jgi:hypothetical protein
LADKDCERFAPESQFYISSNEDLLSSKKAIGCFFNFHLEIRTSTVNGVFTAFSTNRRTSTVFCVVFGPIEPLIAKENN